MSLPSPLPDNPMRWDGWRKYNSPNPYERLCLDFESHPTTEMIEDHCRQMLVWWQKKLPLKNQPSNPMAQLLRGGIDEAPRLLAEARALLLNPAKRQEIDGKIVAEHKEKALDELGKFFDFATAGGSLGEDDEISLMRLATASGFSEDEAKEVIQGELLRRGIKRSRESARPEPPPVVELQETKAAGAGDLFEQFRRILRMSKLEDGDMTDDQRDAMCNIGESLGLTGGQAEDLIDEYLDEMNGIAPMPVAAPKAKQPVRPPVAAAPAPQATPPKPAKNGTQTPSPVDLSGFQFSPVRKSEEQQKYPPFTGSAGHEMLFVPTGCFQMGSDSRFASPNEKPLAVVGVSRFFISKFPITNGQYEKFDPAHRTKRPPWADETHPVVYVTSLEAQRFCDWLTARERKKYRLPTEAEWEYAARGLDGRLFPWGNFLDGGDKCNFADSRTNYAWREPGIDDGWPQSSPVGSHPAGATPFGAMDMSGNVWEWCLDYYAPYQAKDRVNPRGPGAGVQRVYRGGSWKSRVSNVTATARGYNTPNFSSNDVGFRVVCECE